MSAESQFTKLSHLEERVISAMDKATTSLHALSQTQVDHGQVQENTRQYMGTVQHVHQSLAHTISYLGQVSTIQPHKGSLYGAEKEYHLAQEQSKFLTEKLDNLIQLSAPR